MRLGNHWRRGVVLAVAIVAWTCRQPPPTKEVLRPVRYQEVFASGGERVRGFAGVAQAGVESRLSFKVAGTVQQIHVKVGDRVKPGQLIAQLDDGDFQLQVQQAEASLDRAQAERRNAEANYDRVRQLFENSNASRNDLDAARAAAESARAQVLAMTKQLEIAQSQLGYTRIAAPVAGAIATVDVEPNENVNPGQTVVQLSSGANLEVKVAIPEILISQIRAGQIAEVRFDALPQQIFPARITEVGIAPGSFATTFPVTVLLNKTQADIRPGMAAEVLFKFGAAEGRTRFLVPAYAVREDRDGRYVFTVEPSPAEGEGIIHRKTVTTGNLTEEGIEIFEGLIDGSLVVTAGVSQIRDGQRVKLLR